MSDFVPLEAPIDPSRSIAGRRARLRPVLDLAAPWANDLRYGIASGVTHQILFIGGAAIAAYAAGRAVRGASYNSLSLWLLALVLIVLPQVRTPWLAAISFQSIGNRVSSQLQNRVFDQIAALTPAGLAGQRTGELANTAMSDIGVIRHFFADVLPTIVVAAVIPALSIVAIAAIAWPLALIAVPFLVAAVAAPVGFHSRKGRGAAPPAQRADVGGEVVDAIQGLREIVTFGAEGAALYELVERGERAQRLNSTDTRRAKLERTVTELLATAGPLAVLSAGATLTANHHLSRTLLVPAVVLAALAFRPAARLAAAAKGIGAVETASQRMFTLLNQPVPVLDSQLAQVAPQEEVGPAVAPDVQFTNVTFSYSPELPDALRDVSFTVAAGETLALVGHSGAGKSTCINLLLRFWDTRQGSIFVGGVDIRAIPQEHLHSLVGLVTQDVYLFNTTVRENLLLGRPDATDADVELAARAALAWEFIGALPDGLDTIIGERGGQLSGGQRQRIAIARVLLADPPVLVLDEPVSNLDTANEQAINRAMTRLRQGRTTIIVAHRLSTILSAGRVIVLDHGRVAETGTHTELVARSGTYKALVDSQLR